MISISTVGSIIERGDSISIEEVNSRSIDITTIRPLSIALHMCLCDSFRSRLIQWDSIKANDINT